LYGRHMDRHFRRSVDGTRERASGDAPGIVFGVKLLAVSVLVGTAILLAAAAVVTVFFT